VEIQPPSQTTEVLDELKKFTDVLEGAMKQQGAGTFAARDEAETVEVVINGERVVTELHIEDGLLRLGAETVEERINEALGKANAAASENQEAIYGQTFEALNRIVGSLQKAVSE
jgi:ESX secretion-associated protein EspL